MLWELLRYPSDDPQAQVYWRRRVSVLAVVAVVALLMLVMLFRGGGTGSVTPTAAERPAATADGGDATGSAPAGSPAPGAAGTSTEPATTSAVPSASPTPSASASPGAGTKADPATTCVGGSMALRVASDAATYAAGVSPVLTLSVVDIGSQPCVVDLGTTSTSLSVLSGGKPVWSSDDCVNKVSRPVQLTPSAAKMLQLTWDRSGNVNSCSAPPAVPAGQYEVVARVGNSAVYGGSLVLS